MTGYIGIGGTAKKVKNIYVGVGGVAKKVKKGYIGVNGVAKLWYSALPTLKELFSTVHYYATNAGAATTNIQSVNISRIGTWYSILSRGGALCIAKTIIMQDTSLPAGNLTGEYENLVSFAASGVSSISAEAYSNGQYITIEMTSRGRGVHVALNFDDTYPDEVITYVLQNAPKECLRYYNSSTASPSSGSGVEYSAAEAAAKKGYLWAAWPANTTPTNANSSFAKCSTPSNGIFSVSDGTSTTTINKLIVNNGNIYPSSDGSAIARTRCYSLFRFEDVDT